MIVQQFVRIALLLPHESYQHLQFLIPNHLFGHTKLYMSHIDKSIHFSEKQKKKLNKNEEIKKHKIKITNK